MFNATHRNPLFKAISAAACLFALAVPGCDQPDAEGKVDYQRLSAVALSEQDMLSLAELGVAEIRVFETTVELLDADGDALGAIDLDAEGAPTPVAPGLGLGDATDPDARAPSPGDCVTWSSCGWRANNGECIAYWNCSTSLSDFEAGSCNSNCS